jgi:hypothetical protein
MNNFSLSKDGIFIKKSFISSKAVEDISSELSFLFNKRAINGSQGFIDLSTSGYLSLKSNYKKIAFPIMSIRSINLAELSLLVLDQTCEQLNKKREDFFLTALEIFYEINDRPLFWHTDNREGMIRAFIYITGGTKNSGAYMHMKGTHKRDYFVQHELNPEQLVKLKDKIIVCEGLPGDLIIADTVGFHSNCPRINERKVIVFEFQSSKKEGGTYPQSSAFFTSTNLSDEVIKNINIFRNKSDLNKTLHASDMDFFDYKRVRSLDKIYNAISVLNKLINRINYILTNLVKKLKVIIFF